ncbi:hypothetical protein AOL_s00076g272 [Orbilia oligospora ATCC 24927]|uniref:Zn(2)-C6 fungal-type domain-containing protein n=1 Tax=Arthrobotrys oligospora (strain ATCC 24927 / CBS 115.81 / DSM 1491) TaxID=756982 RepID=G1X9G5_ARTOA|nr:hypothetical protein AOL_s00076g272 [Orbilia oligospora ATCC 24927]EGX50197.1 hypothetical protein AOL_s00076g272 [Orbilia oligospora ATCC 24927]
MSEPANVETQPPPDQPEKPGAGGEPSKPTRVSKKRTKTGCLTCRKRRIKCGEERPTCNNCVKSKRVCEGYSQRVVFKLGGFGNEDGQLDGMGYYGYPEQMPYIPGSDPSLPYALQAARGNMNLQRIAPAPYTRRIGDETLPENQLHTTLPPHLQYYMGAQQGQNPLQSPEDIPPGFPQDPNYLRHRASVSPISPIDVGMAHRGSISLVSPGHQPPLSATESHWPASATSATHPNIDSEYAPRQSYSHEITPPSATSSASFHLASPSTHQAPTTSAPSRSSNASEVSTLNSYGYNAPYGTGYEGQPAGYANATYPPGTYSGTNFKTEPDFDQHRYSGPTAIQEHHGQEEGPQDDFVAGGALDGSEDEDEELNDEQDEVEEDEEEYAEDGEDDYEDFAPMDLDATSRQTISTAITPYTQNNESTRLTFRSFLPEAGTLIRYQPAATASPLSNPTTARIFCHWIYVVAPSLSVFERHPANPHQSFTPGTRLNGPQNLWCYTIPTVSLSSPLLLHALLAVASLHIAKLSDEPITSSYVHYHFALRRLRKAISDDRERASVATLAGTLLLAYYETMAADVRKWSSHLQGAKNLLKEIDFDNLNRRMEVLEDEELTQQQATNPAFDGIASIRNRKMQQKTGKGNSDRTSPTDDPIRRYILGSRERRKMSQVEKTRVNSSPRASNARDQETAILQSDLFWFFAKQDAYQSLLSGEGLVLDYAHWGQCPPRPRIGTLGTSYGSTDYLYLLYGRIADFQARDAKRKAEVEKYGPAPAILELMKSMGGGGPPGQGGPPQMGRQGGPPAGPPPMGGPPSGPQGGPPQMGGPGGPQGGPQGGPPPGWTGGPPPGWQGGPPPGWQGGPPPGWQGGPPPGWQGGPPPGLQGGPPPGLQGGPPPGWQGGPPPGWQGGPPPGWTGGPPPGWQGGPPPGMAGPPTGMPPAGMPARPPAYAGPPSISSISPSTEGGDQSTPPSATSAPKSPPKYTKAELESMTVEAEMEWIEIYKALLLFQESLGDEFQPLEEELMPVQPSPFGDAIFYRTYSVSCLQALYKTAHIILERSHPSMPSNGWMAAGIAARKTAGLAQEMGRIAAGLFPPAQASEISPPLGGVLIELSFCMLFAGVQYQDPNQREWLVEHMYNVGKMTGWGTANRCALGCEHAWEKAAAMGKGPPYKRRASSEPREMPIGTQEGSNYVFLGSANKAHWATALLGPLENKMETMALDGEA